MESYSNQKSVKYKKYKIYLRFEILQIATLCLDDSLAHSWHSLNQLHLEFPHMLSPCWLLFLHTAVRLVPNHINWVEVGRLWRPDHLMQHSITLLLGQIAFRRCVGS